MLFARRSLATILSFLMASPSVPAWPQASAAQEDAPKAKPRSDYRATQLKGDDRIRHALNRLTFGPRPGDLDVLRQIGLDAWFEQQLHPQSLDLTDLNARLAEYPANHRRRHTIRIEIVSVDKIEIVSARLKLAKE